MAESTEKQQDKGNGSKVALNLGVALSGEAKGSQTVLLALGISASMLLFCGLGAAGLGIYSSMVWLSIAAFIPIILGSLGWWKCLQLWSRSQPLLDAPQHPPLAGSISFKAGNGSTEISVSGADSIVSQESSRDLILAMMNRYFAQQSLPTPVGQVMGSPADKQNLHRYSDAEAEIAKNQIAEALSASQRQLGDVIRLLRTQENNNLDETAVTLDDTSTNTIVLDGNDYANASTISPDPIVMPTSGQLARSRVMATRPNG